MKYLLSIKYSEKQVEINFANHYQFPYLCAHVF